MKLKTIILFMSLMFIAACGAGSPSGPAQLPQTIEYAGKSVSNDYIDVQTSGNANFAVKDANGNILAPDLVTAVILDENGNEVSDGSYGSMGISDDGQYVEYTATPEFSSLKSTAGIKFTSNVTNSIMAVKDASTSPLATFDFGISANMDQIKNGQYSFRDLAKDFTGNPTESYKAPRVAISPGGSIYMLMTNAYYEDIIDSWLMRDIASFTKGSISDTESSGSDLNFTTPSTLIDYTTQAGDLSAYDLAVLDDNIYAVAYSVGDSNEPTWTKGYLQTTINGGSTWTTLPVFFESDIHGVVFSDIKIASDRTIHVAYYFTRFVEDSPGNWVYHSDLYYTHCSFTSCAVSQKINPDGTVAGVFSSPVILIDESNADLTRVYVLSNESTDLINLKTVLTEIRYTPSDETATVAYSKVIQDSQEGACIITRMESMTLDRQYRPLIGWLEYVSNVSCDDPNAEIFLKYARFNPADQTLSNTTTLATYGTTSERLPNMINLNVDFSNAVHLTWFEVDADNDDPIAISARSLYTVAIYDKNSDTYSLIDTIDGQSAPLIRDLGSYESQFWFYALDAAADNAGRNYLVWFNEDNGNMVFTIGTLWR